MDEKVNAILRVLRGEDRAVVAKELEVSPERLLKWESIFMGAGRSAVALSAQATHSSRRKRKINAGVLAAIAAGILGLILVGVLIWRFVHQLPVVPVE